MVVQLFGIIDLLAAIAIVLARAGLAETFAVLMAAMVLLKSIIFIKDIISILDIVGVIFMLLATAGNFSAVTWLFMIWFLQKGLISLMS